MRRAWVKMWIKMLDKESDFMKMPEDCRFVWLGMIILAGDSPFPGKIAVTEDVGYSKEQIAAMLKTETRTVSDTIRKMGEKAVAVSDAGVITICNWELYQSEYQRQLPYRERYKQKLHKEVTNKSVTESDRALSFSILTYFNTVCNKSLELTVEREAIIIRRLKEGKTEEQLKRAILNFSKDEWEERHKYCDIVYAIGRQKGKPDNFDRWFNYKGGSNANSRRRGSGVQCSDEEARKYDGKA